MERSARGLTDKPAFWLGLAITAHVLMAILFTAATWRIDI